MRKYLILPLMLVMLTTASAFAAHHKKGDWKWWENEEITTQINLTEEQSTEIEGIYESYEPKLEELRATAKEQKKAYYDTMLNSEAPRDEVIGAFDAMSEAKYAAKRAKLDMKLDMREVLSPEQIDEVNEIAREWKEKKKEKMKKKYDK